ncbi:MAG: IS21 family transposase, partial [Richelia sp.]|nr:IS21 family transposase [Richelia sp.]
MLEMQIMYNQGCSLKHIAKVTGYSINTVRKYARDNKEPKYSARPRRSHKLDGFRDYLQARVNEASPNWIPAT